MTEKMHFEILIKANVQKVWDMMLTLETYKQWTSVFEPASYYEGSWEKGSKIKFLGSGGSGMVSEIVENIPNKFISIKHLGEIQNGVEDRTSEKVLKWCPAFENYTFIVKGEETLLEIDMEMPSSEESKAMKEMFEGMWPNALLKLKDICEK
jgi:uncharacterized protein YndB with AHSA1/START domain